MNCGFKIKNTCGEKLYATCTYFEGILPTFSTLVAADCYTLEEIVADVYLQFTKIKLETDVSTILSDSCLEYTLTEGQITVAQSIRTLDLELCNLKTKFDNITKYQLCDLPIAGCDLNLGTLEDACGDTITNYGQLIQALITGGVGAGGAIPVIQNFDVTNFNTSTVNVIFYQPGRPKIEVISLGNTNTVISLDINIPVTVVIKNSNTATAQVYSPGSEFLVNIHNNSFQFTQDFILEMEQGQNSNPLIALYEIV